MADSNGGLSAVESLLGDRYTREARLAPAFLSVFPILLVLLLSFKGLQSAIPALLSLLCVFGVVRWISHIARGIGDKKEVDLFRHWGGKPTTTLMRVALGYLRIKDTEYGDHVRHLLWEAPPGTTIQDAIKQRKGPAPPSVEEDLIAALPPDKQAPADPPAAGNPPAPLAKQAKGKKVMLQAQISDTLDHIYEPAVAWMRENSRDCVLVIEEEISYGFQRNFFALRRFAYACVAVAIVVEVWAAHLSIGLSRPFIHIDKGIAAVILIALAAYLFGLLKFVTEKSVMIQGFIYARALLDSFYAPEPAKPTGKAGAKDGQDDPS
ncbi:MAG TPA: hypothetical protein VGG45_20495 [Terracidiphilus sp.]|jgi:hypothetical protein